MLKKRKDNERYNSLLILITQYYNLIQKFLYKILEHSLYCYSGRFRAPLRFLFVSIE